MMSRRQRRPCGMPASSEAHERRAATSLLVQGPQQSYHCTVTLPRRCSPCSSQLDTASQLIQSYVDSNPPLTGVTGLWEEFPCLQRGLCSRASVPCHDYLLLLEPCLQPSKYLSRWPCVRESRSVTTITLFPEGARPGEPYQLLSCPGLSAEACVESNTRCPCFGSA